MEKEFIKESIEHYRELIDDFDETITKNKKQMVKPGISKEKRHALSLLIAASEKEKRECQKAIRRLLDE